MIPLAGWTWDEAPFAVLWPIAVPCAVVLVMLAAVALVTWTAARR